MFANYYLKTMYVLAGGLGVSSNWRDYLPMALFLGTCIAAVFIYSKLFRK